MHSTIKTEGVILRKRQLLNKDFLVSLFTETLGKITVLAKGVRDIKSRRSSAIMTGNLVNLILSPHGDRYYLQEARIISLFSSIKKDEVKQKTLYLFLYLFDSMLPEGQKETDIYDLQKKFLVELAKAGLSNVRILYYGNNLLKNLGYSSNMDSTAQMVETIEHIIGKKLPPHII